MYQFRWQDMVSDQFAASVCHMAGANPEISIETTRNLLILLFEVTGGLPITDTAISDDDRRKITLGLLENAIREAFRDDLTPFESTGVIPQEVHHTIIENELELGEFVFVNWCKEADLIALPEIGDELAERIVRERRNNGAFKGGKDLAERVSGIGEKTMRKLIRRLRFARRPVVVPSPENISDLIKMLVAKTGKAPEEGLGQILDYTISLHGSRKRVRWYAYQRYTETLTHTTHHCSAIGILQGSEYYYWLGDAIDHATSTIEMAMFHAAMPTDNHPTKDLVDKLIAARNRGIKIRILLDRDREDDPYKSAVINKNALEALQRGGVDARFDSQENLLHSKFLVLDSECAVLGSHNWSAGSYFHYDDLSIVINSRAFALELMQRFDALWAETK